MMKIGIHPVPGGFSDRWIAYCKQENISFKIVNCYKNDILKQLEDCDSLMWTPNQDNYKDVLFAKGLLFSLEQAGIKVFPDFNTAWHFDDKVGQKYLLEAIKAPLVSTYVFYDKLSALKWADKTTYPKVFKLRGGAGSANVSLVKNQRDAINKINKAFGRGFSRFNRIAYLKERFNKTRNGKDNLLGVFKGIGRLFISTEYARIGGREKGYVYFQDFIPNNNFDIRVIVVGRRRAFAITRGVRKGDFRASGSGNINYDPLAIDIRAIKISFDVNKILKSQSIAFDYVLLNGEPLIVEISYGYAIKAYDPCPGYWDEDLNWHEGKFNPQAWMVENLLKNK